MVITRISDRLGAGGQPAEQDLRQLTREGYQTVVNFRAVGEADDQLPPSEEGKYVESLGMRYFHLPTSLQTLGPDVFDRFRAAYPSLPNPIFAHCTSGKRAAAMLLAQVACSRQMSQGEITDAGNHWGLRDKPELIQLVQHYAATRLANSK